MKNKVLVLILILILCGCSNRDNKKCVKSHDEQTTCIMYQVYNAGGTTQMYPYYYPCTKTICDEWEVINENN